MDPVYYLKIISCVGKGSPHLLLAELLGFKQIDAYIWGYMI